MSQAGILVSSGVAPGTGIETITGNSGGPVGPDGGNNINVVGDGITIDIVGSPGTNTLTASVIGSGATVTLNGDVGTIMGSVFTFDANTQAGSSVLFDASISPATMSLVVTDPDNNTIIGEGGGNGTLTGSENTGIGKNILQDLTTGTGNVAMGYLSLISCTTGTENVSIGTGSSGTITTGSLNTVIGADALNIINGSRNIAIGQLSGSAYVGAESSNIVIGSVGVVAENNTLRLGTNGGGAGQQSRCFVAGVDGVNVGSVATVVTEAGNQLGTAVITAGTGITVTPGANSITIASTASSLSYTNVNTSPYVVLANDYYLSVDSSGGPITLRFPDTATLSTTYVVKDRLGTAGNPGNNITITSVGGATLFDGATTFVMNTAFESVFIIGNGASYEIY